MGDLFMSIISNDFMGLQEVLEEQPDMDLDAPLIGSLSALHVAAEKGYTFCAKVLLSAGANVNIQEERGETPLMTAIIAGHPLVAVAILQAKDCDPNCAMQSGRTALFFAAQRGSAGLAQVLLQNGATPDAASLLIALEHKHWDVVRFLVQGCAYIDLRPLTSCHVVEKLLSCAHHDVALWMLEGGYPGLREITNYSTASHQSIQPSLEKFLNPVRPLYFLCRLQVRQLLNNNIWSKVDELHLPKEVKDFLMFKNYYHPPILSSWHQIYSYFNDHSREIFELS